jgi:hypothetical protein
MARKPKFKPTITRVKLNPEQAVLSCDCNNGAFGWYTYGSTNLGTGKGSQVYCNGSKSFFYNVGYSDMPSSNIGVVSYHANS